MGKKKEKKIKVDKYESKENTEFRGKCLNCGKKTMRNIKNCSSCKRKKRLRKKANKRGKSRDYYVGGYD